MVRYTLPLLMALAVARLASAKPYDGPARPDIPADRAPIVSDMTGCLKDAEAAVGVRAADASDGLSKDASELCKLRTEHKTARERLLNDLAKLVAFYREQTNHDHSANLATTIRAIQGVVSACLQAVSSQQYCHNIGCATEPERNFILCETKAADILETIY